MSNSRKPAPVPAIATQIDDAMAAGNTARASELARRAIDMGLDVPGLFVLRAGWHEQAGRYREACADYEHVLRTTPQDPVTLTALARCLAALGHFARAAAAARTALEADQAFAPAHYHLAFALEQLGQLDDARLTYEHAAALALTMPEAHARLAALAARRGDWASARAFAGHALALAPSDPVARFALIMADQAEGHFEQAEMRARAASADLTLVPQARANAFSFLGDALDAQNRTAEAFQAYKRANVMLKALHQAQFERPGVETGNRTVTRLAAEFARIDPSVWSSPTPAAERRHAFVLGFPRSGTTLLAQILAGHPDVAVLDEKPLLRDAILEFSARPGGLARLASATPDELDHWRARYWTAANDAGARTGMLVDKVPLNTLHLPLIARLFPQAKIVFALRDPRDVVFGCFRRLFALNPYLYEFLSLDGAAAFYDNAMQLAARYRTGLPLAVHEVRNEDLIANPDDTIRGLGDFLGLETIPAMTDFARRADRPAITSPGAADLVAGIRGESPAPWRRYGDVLKPVLPMLAPWIDRFGYPHG